MPFFEKYDGLGGRPNGRPVGVQNGQGQQPMSFENPMLKGMAQTQVPMSAPSNTAPAQSKRVAPGPPALPPGTVNSLLDWAKNYVGER